MALAIHTITNRPWSADQCIRAYADAGVKGLTFWRRDFDEVPPAELGRRARDAGLEVTGLARGGFFPATSEAARREAVEDNLRAIDEAAAAGAPVLVLVCGAVPGQALEDSRTQIVQGIAACLPYAAECGVLLAIEPLHPMYADDRSAVVSLRQANDLCQHLESHPNLGIAVDVYHTWWDPDLEAEIARAGRNGMLFAFHICDWKTPTTDLLNDRGLMGEGCIDIPQIRSWMAGAGFHGLDEVEIFSSHYWEWDQGDYLGRIVEAYARHC